MAELTSSQRTALPDSAFAVVSRENGKKVRKYPVNDEAHQKAALAMAHGARSGKPAPAAEQRAVHAAVKSRNKALYDQHMKDDHGAGMLKKAWDGITARFRKPTAVDALAALRAGQPRKALLLQRQAVGLEPMPSDTPGKGGTPRPQPATPGADARLKRRAATLKAPNTGVMMTAMAKGGVVELMPHAQWSLVNARERKTLSTHGDREGAIKAAMSCYESDPSCVDDLRIVQAFKARDLITESATSRSY